MYYNTWSVDGLPGLKREQQRTTPKNIRGAMESSGLQLQDPHIRTTIVRMREASILVLGLFLGIAGTVLVFRSGIPVSSLSYTSIRDRLTL